MAITACVFTIDGPNVSLQLQRMQAIQVEYGVELFSNRAFGRAFGCWGQAHVHPFLVLSLFPSLLPTKLAIFNSNTEPVVGFLGLFLLFSCTSFSCFSSLIP